MRRTIAFVLALLMMFAFAQTALAHCQVPCGIYDDEMRCDMIEEHIFTIERAMKSIEELSSAEKLDYNQIVRWVMTKDSHALEIQSITSEYFMTQRVKPVDESGAAYGPYVRRLTLLHEMLTYAMKAKQTTDLQYVDRLRDTLKAFRAVYFDSAKEHDHSG